MVEESKKELLNAVYKLFSEDNPPHGDKVRTLVPKAGTRNLYYHLWKEAGKPTGYKQKIYERGKPAETKEGAKEGLVTGPAGTLSEPKGGNEQPAQQQETAEKVAKPQVEAGQPKGEIPSSDEETPPGENHKEKSINLIPAFGEAENETFPDLKVAGETLPFRVNLSVKTIALYQLASTEASDNLSLGKFIDTCVEDYFLGRGVDLGLVEKGGKEND